MFQRFQASSSPEQGPPRLQALRAKMAAAGLDAFLVPRADAHQGEYVAPCDARLEWLTGFTGSAGFCAVLADRAGLFVDGRYRLQVRAEVADVFTPVDWPEVALADWLKQALPEGGGLGYDPWLHTAAEIATLRDALTGFDLTPCANLIDRIWADRPAPPDAPFRAHPDALAGETSAAKRARLAEVMTAQHAVLTLPDSIAWLLNIRGSDIPRNPVPQSFAILGQDARVALYAVPGKADHLRDHLGADVSLHPLADFEAALDALRGPVLIDPKSCPEAVQAQLKAAGAEVMTGEDPCLMPKARKTAVEIAGAKAAHDRDAVAMIRFLAWLDRAAPKGGLTEIDVVTKLETCRRETHALQDISFETICGAGPNGAIVHYRVTEETNRPLAQDELLLIDSGGQYLDGTTDITRTVIIGSPSDEHCACYTRVLQGMIAISRIRFPKGVGGQHLDALARAPLWLAGLDYDHGTGHGVGSYLCVHEGPQSLSRRNTVPLDAGMILSNEPGYYRPGAFGIRIENLLVTVPAPPLPGADPGRDMLAFETLTKVPFDRGLIATDMLSQQERDWINAYHHDIAQRYCAQLEPDVATWLGQACAPL